MTGKPKDITGVRVNKLVAVKFSGTKKMCGKRTGAVWVWKCDCGKEVTLLAKAVLYPGGNRKTKKFSCGCEGEKKKHFGMDATINQVFVRHYADGDLTFEDFKTLSQQDCYYCGAPPSNMHTNRRTKQQYQYSGLDRLFNDRPHNKDNVVPCCWICNERKSNMDFIQFLTWISKIYNRRLKT